jgi:hypothetical protein
MFIAEQGEKNSIQMFFKSKTFGSRVKEFASLALGRIC